MLENKVLLLNKKKLNKELKANVIRLKMTNQYKINKFKQN